MTLSGGQKARISLARALYSMERDVFLLDNPLSALDKQVADHVMKYAIKGYLSDKTVLMVSNNADVGFSKYCIEVGEVYALSFVFLPFGRHQILDEFHIVYVWSHL